MPLHLSQDFKRDLIKVTWITFVWTIISLLLFLSGYVTILSFDCNIPVEGPMVFLKGSILTGIAAGVIGGSGLVFLWEKWLRSIPYGKALLYILTSYVAIFLMVDIISSLYFQSQVLGLSIFHSQVWEAVFRSMLELEELHSFFTWMFVVISTLIFFQVNDKYGPGVFRDFLLGKYFQPKREERIFMFLDLRSSTTIAEQLGEVRYFNFIKKVFQVITPAILKSKGEIYQYVGDEVVISWKMGVGTENANCIQCFFDIQQVLMDKQSYFKATYDGIMPEFKAGLHYGYVMAGEIGVVKRDIAYSGDVLNTTARIQAKCNELGVNILLSKFLLDRLPSPSVSNFNQPKFIGKLLLRGKKQEVVLYTV